MQEGWDKPLWISRLLKQNKQDIMDKLDSIENIFKKAGDATATDSDIVKPKTAYNGNTLLTGTLEDKTGTTSYTANTTLDSTNKLLRMQVPSVGKYGVGNYLQQSFANIANLIGLTSAKLLKNNTVLGITGNSSNMDTSGCDVAAAQILSGKKAGVKGNTVTGTMANKAGTTVKAAAVTQDDNNTYFALPVAGYYDTASKVYTENSNLGSKPSISYYRNASTTSFTINNSNKKFIYLNYHSESTSTPTISNGTILKHTVGSKFETFWYPNVVLIEVIGPITITIPVGARGIRQSNIFAVEEYNSYTISSNIVDGGASGTTATYTATSTCVAFVVNSVNTDSRNSIAHVQSGVSSDIIYSSLATSLAENYGVLSNVASMVYLKSNEEITLSSTVSGTINRSNCYSTVVIFK